MLKKMKMTRKNILIPCCCCLGGDDGAYDGDACAYDDGLAASAYLICSSFKYYPVFLRCYYDYF